MSTGSSEENGGCAQVSVTPKVVFILLVVAIEHEPIDADKIIHTFLIAALSCYVQRCFASSLPLSVFFNVF
jgi:hypothetical protein